MQASVVWYVAAKRMRKAQLETGPKNIQDVSSSMQEIRSSATPKSCWD